jgi:hypothetical protein
MIDGSKWQATAEPALRGACVEWLEPGYCLLSRRNQLFEARDPLAAPRKLAEFPAPALRRIGSRLGLLRRFLRFYFYNTLRLADGSFFVSFHKSLAVLRDGCCTPLAGLRRPCKILRGGCALAGDGNVYFGEYILNDARDCEVHLYRHVPGSGCVDVIRTLPVGFTRHIHGIFWNPHEQALWALMGDRGHECRVLRSRDGLASFETVGEGDESWRTVSCLFRRDATYYATDAQFEANHIFRLDRVSGRRDALGEIDGPVYYAHAVGDDLFFASSAELCPSQRGRRTASLWHVDAADNCRRVATFEKDVWPVLLFLAGSISFPRGPGLAGETYFSTTALRGADGATFRLRRSAAAV